MYHYVKAAKKGGIPELQTLFFNKSNIDDEVVQEVGKLYATKP